MSIDNDLTDLYNSIYPGGASQPPDYSQVYGDSGSSGGDSGRDSSDKSVTSQGDGTRNADGTRANGIYAGMSDDEIAQVQDLLRQSAGLNRMQIEAQIKAEKAKLEFQYEQLRKVGIPTYKLDKWYKEQTIALSQKAHKLEQEKTNLDALKWMSSLGGPENYFQAADFAAGYKNMQPTAAFLQGMLDGTSTPAFTQYGGTPSPQTAQSVAQSLGMTTAQGGSVAESPSQWDVTAQTANPANPAVPVVTAPSPTEYGSGNQYVTSGAPGAAANAVTAPAGSTHVRRELHKLRRLGMETGNQVLPDSQLTNSAVAPAVAALGSTDTVSAMPVSAPSASPTESFAAAQSPTGATTTTPTAATSLASSDAANLQAIRDIFTRGAHRLAPGTVESMDESDVKLFGSGLKKIGADPARFFRDYQRSRPAQGNPLAA